MAVSRLALVLLFVGAFSGCKLFRREGGRVVVREGTGASSKVVAHRVGDTKPDDLFLGASGALPYPNGTGLLVVDASNALTRYEPGRSGGISCAGARGASLQAVDDAGNHVLFTTPNGASKTETVHFMDVTTCAETTLEVRSAYRGDVSRDGREAAIGAFPTSCTDPLDGCPITLYRLRPAGSPVPTDVIRENTRAHYQPRYFPNDTLVFQTTERDASCAKTINGCRHDIVSVPVGAGPTEIPKLIREGALSAGISPDGKSIAYLSYMGPETSCHGRLPCKTMTLAIGDWRKSDASKDVSIAKSTVSNVPGHPFSPDGRSVAFATGEHYDPSTCRVDGTHCTTYAGHLVGWLK